MSRANSDSHLCQYVARLVAISQNESTAQHALLRSFSAALRRRNVPNSRSAQDGRRWMCMEMTRLEGLSMVIVRRRVRRFCGPVMVRVWVWWMGGEVGWGLFLGLGRLREVV